MLDSSGGVASGVWVVRKRKIDESLRGIGDDEPLVAGVEYFSGREPGGGCRFKDGRGRPLDIAGSTATASPIAARRARQETLNMIQGEKTLTKFLPKALRAKMIESVVSGLSGRHRRSKV